MRTRAAFAGAIIAVLGIAAGAHAQQAQAKTQAEIEAEREQARFRAMDVNNDGVITLREWRGNSGAFHRYDTNRDGILSGTEIWIPERRPAANERGEQGQWRDELLKEFNKADRNRDGRLGRNEWWSDAATFVRVDTDRDGWLSPSEYLGTDEPIDQPVRTGNDRLRQTPAYKAGYERGLVDGRQAGKEDKEGPNRWDLEGQRELEQADAGYSTEIGRRDDYQAGYRAGFRLGYRKGFGPGTAR